MRKLLIIMLGIAAGFAAIRWTLRPAALREARVALDDRATNPRATVDLGYSPGLRPASVILDLSSGSATGSATISDVRLPSQIVLGGQADERYTLAITARYRILGVVKMLEQHISGMWEQGGRLSV